MNPEQGELGAGCIPAAPPPHLNAELVLQQMPPELRSFPITAPGPEPKGGLFYFYQGVYTAYRQIHTRLN